MVGIEHGRANIDLNFPPATQEQGEAETKKQHEIWIIDENAPGYISLASVFQKDHPSTGFKIFGKFATANEEIEKRADAGQKLPDIIYLGNDYSNKNAQESALEFQEMIAGKNMPEPPMLINIKEHNLKLSGEFSKDMTLNLLMIESSSKHLN